MKSQVAEPNLIGVRLRIGDWRIIFYEDQGTIVIAAVGHRREIYD
jgi:mRNA interferase RelE/StbE